ncbi:MAG: shikimate dehydrogenase [Fimbriimonas ginsengisoli]|uniref:Shikimate dehydrogenase n=1 Tax=Fimbriimonas ginsengisoli TaxID=1005039 RepID=A0A931LTB8_FIMGI|nr:shikimate dehydrogenase [Fimbriimonas ginsengisoli]MBI3722234.1 shikimate dehydrogenase [Fimbriimonas ginsengisoli]
MTRFAFIIHPLSTRDVARKYPFARFVPGALVEAAMRRKKPMVLSKIDGIRSATGATTEGWFIGCPLTPKQMMTMPIEEVYARIGECAQMAHELGAQVIGLGAFTSVVGDGGVTVAERAKIAVTTGNSYTVATAIEGTLRACEMLDFAPQSGVLAVVGATGAIGKTCAKVLARSFGKTILVGRDLARTQAVADEIPGAIATTDVEAIREADAVVAVSSAEEAIIMPDHLKPGAVVCDVARPRDVSRRVAKERPDVLVIEGGVVEVPGDVRFNFNFGFPDKTAYACMSETMLLALEDRPVSYTLGKDVSVEQVDEMFALARKHGFRLAGFRSFEKATDPAAIERARAARRLSEPPAPPAAQTKMAGALDK